MVKIKLKNISILLIFMSILLCSSSYSNEVAPDYKVTDDCFDYYNNGLDKNPLESSHELAEFTKSILCNNGNLIQGILSSDTMDSIKQNEEEGDYEYVEEIKLPEVDLDFLEILLKRLKENKMRVKKRISDYGSLKMRRPALPFRLGGRLGRKRISTI